MKCLTFGSMVVVLLLSACSAGQGGAASDPVRTRVRIPRASPAAPTSPTPPGSPTPETAASPAVTRFQGSVTALPSGLAAAMRGTTWHPGCPAPLSELRLLTFRYWGFDGVVREGPMVVNKSAARGVLTVFRALFRARFPINDVHLALKYVPGHEDPTDHRDYTAGFNCRPVVTARGPKDLWSQHAFGLAIDINPIENPYVTYDGYVRNLNARPYRNRSLGRPGMITRGSVVVRAFAAIGWTWGGSWSGDKDYMHFSSNGR